MYIEKFGLVSFSQGKDFRDVIKRPNLTIEDARAIERSPLDRRPWRWSSAAASRPDRSG